MYRMGGDNAIEKRQEEAKEGENETAEHDKLPRGPFLSWQDDGGRGVCSSPYRPRKDLFSQRRRFN
jgi:hypothetical protein